MFLNSAEQLSATEDRPVTCDLCAQVGVGALVIGYAILGAVAFMSIEQDALDELVRNVTSQRQTVARQLWNVTRHIQFNRARWDKESLLILKEYQVRWRVHQG